MLSKLSSFAATAALLLSASVLAVTPATAAPSVNEPGALLDCSHPHSNKDDQWGLITGNGVNYRSGPHTSCASYGQFNRGDKIFYHCSDGGWTWGRREGTSRQGWISNSYLNDGGSNVRC